MKKGIKKVTCILIAGALIFSLAACSSGGDDTEEDTSADTSYETVDDTEETYTDTEETYDETGDVYETYDEASTDSEDTVEINQAFIDDDVLTVTAENIRTDEDGTIILTVTLKNNSDKNYVIESGSAFIDGFEYSSTIYTYLMAGDEEEDEAELSSLFDPGIDINNINEVGIELTALADAGETVGEAGNFYVYLENEEEVSYTRENEDSDILLYDDDNVTITYVGMKYSDRGEGNSDYFYSYFYIENKTDEDIYLNSSCNLINGSDENFWTADNTYTSQWVCAGKCKYIAVSAECSSDLGYEDASEILSTQIEMSGLYFLADRSDTGDQIFSETFDLEF